MIYLCMYDLCFTLKLYRLRGVCLSLSCCYHTWIVTGVPLDTCWCFWLCARLDSYIWSVDCVSQGRHLKYFNLFMYYVSGYLCRFMPVSCLHVTVGEVMYICCLYISVLWALTAYTQLESVHRTWRSCCLYVHVSRLGDRFLNNDERMIQLAFVLKSHSYQLIRVSSCAKCAHIRNTNSYIPICKV